MSMFDPQSFLDAQTTDVNEKRALLAAENPGQVNGLYDAVIGDIKPASGNKDGRAWLRMDVEVKVPVPPEQRPVVTLEELKLTHRVFIDLTSEGNVDNAKGKNNGQRLLREATGLNVPGQPFSWRMLSGRPVKVKIKHATSQNGNVFEDIGGVFPA